MIVPPGCETVMAMQRSLSHGERARYIASVENDYDMLEAYFPLPLARFMDIGGGLGGLAALVCAKHPECSVVFIDGDGQSDKDGFRADFGAQNDMALTRALFDLNGIDAGRIAFQPIGFGTPTPCDMVISLLSCGFHYPVADYLGLISASLGPGGVLILDLRFGEDWQEQDILDAGFIINAQVDVGLKHRRMSYQRL